MSIRYEMSRWVDYPASTGIKEEKVDIIAATGMSFTGRAQNIVLKREYTGKDTLEFDMPVKYIDSLTGEWVINPLCKKIIEKTKIKLWRDERWYNHFTKEWQQGRWYEFIVASHKEKRSKKQLLYSYKCDSLFMNELSRNGYSLQFVADTDLMAANGMGTAHDLAKRIVDGTDWEYVKTETFPDYKEEFNAVTGETVKIPVSTDQIEFVEGLDRYAYCCEILVDKDNQEEILSAIEEQLRSNNLDINRFGFSEDNKFYWAAKTGDKNKNYIYNHQRTGIIVNVATPVVLNDNGKITYHTTETDISPIKTTLFNDSLNLWENVRGTTEIGAIGSAEFDTFQSLMVLNPLNSMAAVVYKGYETNSINAGDLYAVKIAFTEQQLNDRENNSTVLPSSVTFEVLDNDIKDENEKIALSFNLDIDTSDDGFENTYFVSMPKRVTKPHFKISVNSAKSVAVKAIYIYQLTGATKELNKEINRVRSQSSEQVGLLSELLNNLALEGYTANSTYNLLKDNSTGIYTPIWLGFSQITSEGYDKAAETYLVEFKEKGSNYDIYLPINEKNAAIKKLSSYNNDKRRAISGEKSNRYSLLETVARTFRCFTRFIVEHDEFGYIKTENGKPIKRFTFVSELGRNQFNGFNYGVNLESVERSIESENLVTKLHVESLDNQYTNSNMVTIQESQYNTLGMTYLYNFSYYIQMGMLNKDVFLKDYQDLINYVGTRTKENLAEIQNYSADLSQQSNLENDIYMIDLGQNSLNTQVNELCAEISWDNFVTKIGVSKEYAFFPNIDIKAFGLNYYNPDFNFDTEYFMWETSPNLRIPKYFKDAITLATYMAYNMDKGEPWNYINGNLYPIPEESSQWSKLEVNSLRSNLQVLFNYQTQYQNNIIKRKNLQEQLDIVSARVKEYEEKRNTRNNEIQAKIAWFERRYSQFIIEGTWQGTDYIEADTFYLDATRAHAESCMPKVSYSIGAVDLSKISNPLNPEDTDWGKDFVYDVGDTSYIKDEELFGNVEQLAMIASITSYIDEDKQDKIDMRNYETRFEELFQQIAASVTSVQLNESTWGRASAIMADNSINEAILQKSFNKNYNLVISSANNSVTQDRTGLTIKDNDTGSVLRAIGGGIFFSKDGGYTFKAGITPDGMNASLITAGRIDTSRVVIRNDDTPLFNFDSQGLTAYRTIEDGAGFTRFDQFGIYSTDNKQAFGIDWWKVALVGGPEQYIINNSIFSLTREGLNFKYQKGGLTLGTLDDGYGLEVKKDEEVMVKIGNNGNAFFKGDIIATSLNLTADAYVGGKIVATEGSVGGWIINEYSIKENGNNGLPEGYELVDYIETDGESYIDTEFIPNQNSGFEIDFITNNTFSGSTGAYGCIFGTRQGSKLRELQLTTYIDNISGFKSGTLRFGNKEFSADLFGDIRIMCKLKNSYYTTSNGKVIELNPDNDNNFEAPYSLTIGALSTDSSGTRMMTQYGKVRIYSFKLYNGDKCVRDFVPVRLTGTEIGGLYDLINKKFYGNSGTGTLLIGAAPSWETTLDSSTGTIISKNIIAKGGTIGGWNITSAYLDSKQGKARFYLASAADSATKWISATDSSGTETFYVGKDGSLKATKATIDGVLTAGSGSKIANWTITGNRIENWDGTYRVGIQHSASAVFYAGCKTEPGGSIAGTATNPFAYSTFYVTNAGKLYAQDAEIKGKIEAGSVLLDGVTLGTGGNTKFYDYEIDNVVGTKWMSTETYTDNNKVYGKGTIIVANRKNSSGFISLIAYGTDGNTNGSLQLNGTYFDQYANVREFAPAEIVSDINKKHQISALSSQYSILFDNLQPVTYKYNDGTSNRLHTGFIAQQVNDALQIANIDSKNFAGLVISDYGTENELWTLRYSEFIALNTSEIQKAKSRISELESRVFDLEYKLATLTNN